MHCLCHPVVPALCMTASLPWFSLLLTLANISPVAGRCQFYQINFYPDCCTWNVFFADVHELSITSLNLLSLGLILKKYPSWSFILCAAHWSVGPWSVLLDGSDPSCLSTRWWKTKMEVMVGHLSCSNQSHCLFALDCKAWRRYSTEGKSYSLWLCWWCARTL